jgi:hypothetical protein
VRAGQEVARPALHAQQGTQTDAAHYLDQFVDTSVKPGVDFNKYALGKWINAHPIPADERSWGVAKVVQEETYQRLQKLSQDAASSRSERGSNAQKIGDFWTSATDTAAIDKQGVSALQPEFDRIQAIKDRQALLDTAAHHRSSALIVIQSHSWDGEQRRERGTRQGPWAAGPRYTDDDERTQHPREYVQHVARMFEPQARPQCSGGGRDRDAYETPRRPARHGPCATAEELPQMTLDEFPRVSAGHTLAQPPRRGRERHDTVVVGQPEFFAQLQVSPRRACRTGRPTCAGCSSTAMRRS